MAVSGGIHAVPHADHFVSLDKAMHFPDWLTGSTQIQKHVPINAFTSRWQMYPNVKTWEYIDAPDPSFTDGPCVAGPLPRNHSLLFAVQVAARLGFNRCLFVGCDLLDNESWAITDVLQTWWPPAKAAGIVWENASPISSLDAWMPRAEELVTA